MNKSIFKTFALSISIVGTLTLINSCTTANKEVVVDVSSINKENPAQAVFGEDEFDFGQIAAGEKVTHSFTFINEGKSPLIIFDVQTSCGCTVPNDWSKDPILPGDEGHFTVTYDSQGNSGKIIKYITLLANTYPKTSTRVKLTGEVIGVQ